MSYNPERKMKTQATEKSQNLSLKPSSNGQEDDLELLQDFVDKECEKINTWHSNTSGLRKKFLGDKRLPQKYLLKQSAILTKFAEETELARSACYAEYSGMIAEAVQDSGEIKNIFANLLTQMMMNSSPGTPNLSFMSGSQHTPSRSVVSPAKVAQKNQTVRFTDKEAEKNHFNKLLQRDLLSEDTKTVSTDRKIVVKIEEQPVATKEKIPKAQRTPNNSGEALGKRAELQVIENPIVNSKPKDDEFAELSTASRAAKISSIENEASDSEPSRQSAKSMIEKFSMAINSEDSSNTAKATMSKRPAATQLSHGATTTGIQSMTKKPHTPTGSRQVSLPTQATPAQTPIPSASPVQMVTVTLKELPSSSVFTPAPYELNQPVSAEILSPREMRAFKVQEQDARLDLKDAKYLLSWPPGSWSAVVDDTCVYRLTTHSNNEMVLGRMEDATNSGKGLFGLRTKLKRVVANWDKVNGAGEGIGSCVVKVRDNMIYAGYGNTLFELVAEDSEKVPHPDSQFWNLQFTKQLDISKGLYDFDIFKFQDEKIIAYLSSACDTVLMIESSDTNTQVVEKDMMLCYKSAEVGDYKTKFRKVLLLTESLALVAATRVHLKDPNHQFIDLHLFQFSQAKCKHKFTESIRFQKTSVAIDIDLLAVWTAPKSASDNTIVACIDHENNKAAFLAVDSNKKTLHHVGEDECIWPEIPLISLISDNQLGEFLAIEASDDSEDAHSAQKDSMPVLLYHVPVANALGTPL